MVTIDHGRLVHLGGSNAKSTRAVQNARRNELAIAAIIAAWMIVLLCGYLAATAG